jgi:hypothetical protein
MSDRIFDSWCEQNDCKFYYIGEFSDGDGQPYTCHSCELQGQPYHVNEIAGDCPFNKKPINSGYPLLADGFAPVQKIKKVTLDAMIEALGICMPDVGFKLKDGNKDCEFCKVYAVCQLIGNDENIGI